MSKQERELAAVKLNSAGSPDLRWLGKKPARNDPRTLKFVDYLTASALPPPPTVERWSKTIKAWPMACNNLWGCCVESGGSHAIECETTDSSALGASPGTLRVSDSDVLLSYEEVAGFNPNAGPPGANATDAGTDVSAFMSWWQQTGYPVDGERHKIGAYVSVDFTNLNEVKQAIALMGGVLFGWQLPVAVQGMDDWRTPPKSAYGSIFKRAVGKASAAPTGNWAAGSWGGHCTFSSEYDGWGFGNVSWGMWIRASYEFAQAYLDECFAMVSTDWLGPNGNAPSGFNAAQLTTDLAMLSAS